MQVGSLPLVRLPRSEVVESSPTPPPGEPPPPAADFFYYWNLNESPAPVENWLDAYKGQVLTGNTDGERVTPTTGKISGGARFYVSSGSAVLHLALGYNIISWNQSNSINLWFKLDEAPSATAYNTILWNGQGWVPFSVFISQTEIGSGCTMTSGTAENRFSWSYDLDWHMLTFVYSDSPRSFSLSLDDGDYQTVSLPNPLSNPNAGAIYFGAGGNTGNERSLKGRLDMIGVFPYALTPEQRTFLWNGGTGREYPW